MNPYCKNCDSPYCYEEIVCPECRGSGLLIGMFIGGEPNFYGLQHPCKLPCRVCDGRKTIIVYCPEYSHADFQ